MISERTERAVGGRVGSGNLAEDASEGLGGRTAP